MADQLFIVSGGQTSSGLVVELPGLTSVAILQVESGGLRLTTPLDTRAFFGAAC